MAGAGLDPSQAPSHLPGTPRCSCWSALFLLVQMGLEDKGIFP